MTPDQWPDTYEVWGAEKFNYINQMQWLAAEYILKNYDCYIIENLAMSGSRSSPPDNIVYYSDCLNGGRFYVTNQEIEEHVRN